MARKKEVRRRKAKLDKYQVIEMMLAGKSDEEIAKELDSSKAVVSKVIHRHIKQITNVRETQLLVNSTNKTIKRSATALKTMAKTRTINDKFLELLSEPDSDTLTDQEMMYVMGYVMTGEAQEALIEAGLSAGLQAPNSGDRDSMGYCLKLRCNFLNNKPNIKAAIEDYRRKKFEKQLQGIDKRFVQQELLEQLDEMKNSPFAKKRDVLACLRMIGETVGAYTQNIGISKINPEEAMDELIEMVQSSGQGKDEEIVEYEKQ